MNNQYDWDLESLLENTTLEKLYEDWKKSLDVLLTYKDNFYESKLVFKNYHQALEKNELIANRLFNYVSNHLNEDNDNEKWVSWSQKLANDLYEYESQISNHDNLLIKNKSLILDYIEDEYFADYRREYKLFYKNSFRVLSDKEEKLILLASKSTAGFEDIYSSIVRSTIEYEDAYDSKNNIVKLDSMAKVFKILKHADRTLRKNTWISFNKAYYDYRFSLTKTLYYNYLYLNDYSKIRKYADYIEQACDADEVTKDFVLKIYKGVEGFASAYAKYRRLRDSYLKTSSGIEKLEPWDKTLPVVKIKNNYSIEQIQEILLDAFTCYGDEYVSVIKRAFDERWISWMPKKGKQRGAYSIAGTKGLKKYFISMNYNGTIDSLFTAAHELGHSLHSYYFNKKQKVNCSAKIFYAEIASITNEYILNYYLLLKSNNKKEKIFLLDEMLSGFFNTTTRQIIFSNFEYDIINKINNNLPITYNIIEQVYQDMNEKYTSIKARNTKKPYLYNNATILRIDHFYIGNFYVYKYAIGQICAIIAAKKIRQEGENYLQKYLNFLQSGSSLSPLDTIKLLGIDFDDRELWNEVNAEINNLLEQYKKLVK